MRVSDTMRRCFANTQVRDKISASVEGKQTMAWTLDSSATMGLLFILLHARMQVGEHVISKKTSPS
jgi:hypothetical protein